MINHQITKSRDHQIHLSWQPACSPSRQMRRTAHVLVGTVWLLACHPAIHSTLSEPPTAKQMAELWYAPESGRDLFWGVGGERLAPDANAPYRILEVKKGGFSTGLTVEGPDKRNW